MEKKITITKSMQMFEKLNVPKLDISYINETFEVPLLEFNRKYFIYRNDELIAFRIMAFSLYDIIPTKPYGIALYDNITPIIPYGIAYLVQLPNQPLQWINDFIQRDTFVFNSVEDFLEHQVSSKNNAIKWTYLLNFLRETKLYSRYSTSLCNRKLVWKWNNNKNCPTDMVDVPMKYFVVQDNEVIIGIDTPNVFLSKEECVKNRIDGLNIIDFDDDSINVINIEVEVEIPMKKVHTLRFIEDE